MPTPPAASSPADGRSFAERMHDIKYGHLEEPVPSSVPTTAAPPAAAGAREPSSAGGSSFAQLLVPGAVGERGRGNSLFRERWGSEGERWGSGGGATNPWYHGGNPRVYECNSKDGDPPPELSRCRSPSPYPAYDLTVRVRPTVRLDPAAPPFAPPPPAPSLRPPNLSQMLNLPSLTQMLRVDESSGGSSAGGVPAGGPVSAGSATAPSVASDHDVISSATAKELLLAETELMQSLRANHLPTLQGSLTKVMRHWAILPPQLQQMCMVLHQELVRVYWEAQQRYMFLAKALALDEKGYQHQGGGSHPHHAAPAHASETTKGLPGGIFAGAPASPSGTAGGLPETVGHPVAFAPPPDCCSSSVPSCSPQSGGGASSSGLRGARGDGGGATEAFPQTPYQQGGPGGPPGGEQEQVFFPQPPQTNTMWSPTDVYNTLRANSLQGQQGSSPSSSSSFTPSPSHESCLQFCYAPLTILSPVFSLHRHHSKTGFKIYILDENPSVRQSLLLPCGARSSSSREAKVQKFRKTNGTDPPICGR